MADEKISAMTAASQMANADVMPIVQGGANLKATKLQLLTGASGEDLTLTAHASQSIVLQGPASDPVFALPPSAPAHLHTNNGFFFGNAAESAGLYYDGSSDMGFVTPNGPWTISITGGTSISFVCDTNAGTIYAGASHGFNCDLSGLTSGNWATSPPPDLVTFINRIATKVKALNGGTPIP